MELRWMIAGLITVAVAGCASSTPRAAASDWQEPAKYTYAVDSRCGERQLFGLVRMTVVNGTVTAAEGLDEPGSISIGAGEPRNLPTLKQLLDQYNTALRDNADLASAEFDPADGHPVKIDLDPEKAAIDDEACYRITEFTPGS